MKLAPLLVLAGFAALAASSKKRRPLSNLEQEAERIVRESEEIIHGKRDRYTDTDEDAS